MSDDSHLRPLEVFQAQLTALRPAAAQFDRDALFYAAGQAAAQANDCAQPRSFAAMALGRSLPLALVASWLLAATFATLWWNAGEPLAPQVVHVAPPSSPTAADEPAAEAFVVAPTPTSAGSYLRLRQVALREGVDAWDEQLPPGPAAMPSASGWRSPLEVDES